MIRWLTTLDRRWIFLAMLLAVAIPILLQKTFPVAPTPLAKSVFDRIESLPAGSRVLIAFDYDPGSMGELAPMATALLRHCCLKGHKVYMLTLWPTGLPLLDDNIHAVVEKEFPQLKYGVDFVNLGYKPGDEVVINVIATNLRQLFPTDNRGNNLDELSITRDVKSLQDLQLILDLSSGYPGLKEWVQYAGSPHQIPVAGGCTAVSAPQLYPYIPDQMFGLLAAIKGAAEYEAALAARYPRYAGVQYEDAIRRMAPQLWAHLLMVGLIVLGNVTYFATRRRGDRP